MPKITLNRQVVEKAIGKKLSESELKDRISMLGTDLDNVTKDEIVVEIFPNRPDMLSEQGFSRALSSFVGAKVGFRKYTIKKANYKVNVDSSVNAVRPFTVCAVVKGLSLNEEKLKEIIQLQEKLHVTHGRKRKKCAIGVYPLDKITMPITYKALPPSQIKFQPLESNKVMSANEILKEHPKGKEFAHLLDGAKVYPLFIDAKNEVLSMPPIINAEKTGKVTTKTKDVFVECSGYSLENLQVALSILVTTLAEFEGTIYSVEVSYGKKKLITPNLTPRKMKLDIPYYNRLIGLNLSSKDVAKCLQRMGHGIEGNNVLVPAYRSNILHQADIAEDIAIAYGFENFVAEIPKVATIGERDAENALNAKMITVLNGLGFLETSTYHIANDYSQTKKMHTQVSLIKLSNALSADFTVMRAWLLPNLMEVLAVNTRYEYPQKLCESGTVFREGKTETGVEEVQSLAGVIAHANASFTEGKQVVEALAKAFDMKVSFEKISYPSFIEGRAAKILVDKKEVGILGEINPAVLVNFNLEVPVVGFELIR